MIRKPITIQIPSGLEARPVALCWYRWQASMRVRSMWKAEKRK